MKPVDVSNFSPILLLEVDLSQPLSDIDLVDPDSGNRYTRARVLVRIHTSPIGYIDIEPPSGRLGAEMLSQIIWDKLWAEITHYLMDNNLPVIVKLGSVGLSQTDIPSYIQARKKLLQDARLVSVVVTTRNRPTSLEETIRSISAVRYPTFEIIIIDNAPSNEDTAELVSRLSFELRNLRYIRENRIGLSWARNCGLEAAQGVITVFTDDDVLVDPDWLTALVQEYSNSENVACVNGLILPRELETPAQAWCEEHGGFGKGFTPQVFDLTTHRPDDPLFPYRLSMFGSGANMSFRTDILRQLGGFDPALGAGTPTLSAAEFSPLYAVIMNNYQIAYQPNAIVYHSHHEQYEHFRQQFYGYGVGFTAFLTKIIIEKPKVVLVLLQRLMYILFFLFSPKSPRHMKKEAGYPKELNRLELLGMLFGPIAYIHSWYLVRKSKRKQPQPIDRVAGKSRPASWGWMPMLTLISVIGLLLVAVANMLWRAEGSGANAIFWIGLLTIYMPIALRLAFPDISREERITLIIILALTLYGVKLLNSPLSFKNFDELLHWRTATDIIQTGSLFKTNPILPISPYYPGMENIVSALNNIGGFDIYWSGVILVGMGRIVLVICLYMFYRRVSGSEQLAGIAILLYMANPSFLYFDAMFAYESLALSFAVLALFAITRWLYERESHLFSLTLVMAIAMFAVIITHHLTVYAMIGILVLWAIVDTVYRRFNKNDQPHIGWIPALFAVVFSLIWLVFFAKGTIAYISPLVKDAVTTMIRFLSGQSSGRVLFSTNIGTKAPLIEQISGYIAIVLIMIWLTLGLVQIWRNYRKNIPIVMLGICALAYPVSQAFRLVHIRADIPGRIVEFVFIPLALVMAIGIIDFLLPYLKIKELGKYIIVAVISGIIFMGSAAIGWKPLPPGPYLVASGTRSVDEQSMAAAQWAKTDLGIDHRIIADRINGLLMVAYGDQYQVTLSEDWIQIPDVFLAPWIGPEEGFILWDGRVEYLIADQRLSSALPFLGFYFEPNETGAFQYTKPIDPQVLSKFDEMDNVSRLYDNGNIRIFDVRKLWNEP